MLIRIFRTIVFCLFTLIFLPLVVFLYLLSFKRLPDSWVAAAIRFWGAASIWIFGVELEFVNPSTFQDRRPRVMICNHQSAFDLLWAARICPSGFFAIGKKEIIFVPVINLVWWAFNLVRVDRGNTRKAIESLRGVADEVVKNSRTLFVSPEGTRSYDGPILPFKKGPFHIAFERNIPIYPVVIFGVSRLLPRDGFLPKPGKMRMYFLPPVETQGKSLLEMDAFIAEVRQQMITKLDEISFKEPA